jgi:hypothetical protein
MFGYWQWDLLVTSMVCGRGGGRESAITLLGSKGGVIGWPSGCILLFTGAALYALFSVLLISNKF